MRPPPIMMLLPPIQLFTVAVSWWPGDVVTRDTGVGSIFAETVGPAIIHGAAIDMDAEGSRRIGRSDGSSSKRGIVGHSCSAGAVMASCLCSEFVMAFLVGLGEAKLEVG